MKKNLASFCFVLFLIFGVTGCDYSRCYRMTITSSQTPLNETRLTEQEIAQINTDISFVANQHGYTNHTELTAWVNERNAQTTRLCSYRSSHEQHRVGPYQIIAIVNKSNSMVEIGVGYMNTFKKDRELKLKIVFDAIFEELSKHPFLRIKKLSK